MKIKAGKKIIPLFEKKKAAPVQRPNFSGANPGFPRPSQSFQKGMRPGTGYPGQRPVFKPELSMNQEIGSNILTKKEKPKDITKVIANLPKDELYAWVSIIVGLIFIFVGILML